MNKSTTFLNYVIILVTIFVESAVAQDSSYAVNVETFMLESKIFGNSRNIRIALPQSYYQADHRRQKYPILYLNDGFAVFKANLWNSPQIVSRLVRENKIPEIILVGIDNGATAIGGSPDKRTSEYVPYQDTINEPSVPDPQGSKYPDFLLNEVIPAVAHRYRVKLGAEFNAIGGASYGGLAALYTVIHHPGIFSALMIESTPTFIADSKILKEAKTLHNWPKRVYIGIGTEETENKELNKAAIPRCEQLRDTIKAESPSTKVKLLVGQGDIHSAKSWSKRFPSALEFLFVSTPKDE